ncbi:gliding motility lipoprotein GldB [Aureibacter tunicatorum]|uniref:Gliding motility-associated lipoprotein GldB n=1 Tax=Aureibacter tunicatorum TaxID=866807 RepID=A0AAE3XJS6_9BACT|nr:gliding motility lipoprotein GldB [Aureibacter tunicatorum]MDR6237240.1 gliding motility-associated lipoprotein GldB [Aureibacter tunicatorum]BDD06232.1 gliding motility lipoprotein GldB [Aureibacter tunicatorum]
MTNSKYTLNTKLFLWLALCIITLQSCDKGSPCENKPDLSNIDIKLNFIALEDQMMKLSDSSQVDSFAKQHPIIAQEFLNRAEYNSTNDFNVGVSELFSNPHIDTLHQEAKQYVTDVIDLKSELEEAFKMIKYNYPQFEAPTVKTVVSGLGKDLFISDSLIVIGLDYYIGENAKYKPIGLPKYVLKRFQREYIVPSIVLLISNKFNASNLNDKTLLAEMIYYGKSYQFAKEILPCTPDSVILGYTAQDIQGAEENQHIIWANIIENEMLYSTSHVDKGRFINERPKTLEIGPKCPGRIGHFIGWKIIQNYTNESPESLSKMMEHMDAPSMFKKSKYKPS